MVTLSALPELVYFGTLHNAHPVSRRALNSLLRSTTAPRMLDINLREPWYKIETIRNALQQANLLKLNECELASLVKMLKIAAKTPVTSVKALIAQYSLARVGSDLRG